MTGTGGGIQVDNSAANLILTSSLTGASPLTVAKTGPGTLTLSPTSDNTNLQLNVAGGTAVLAAVSSGTLHSVLGITGVSPGATLQLSNFGGSQQISSTGSGVLNMNGTFDLNGQIVLLPVLSGSGLITNSSNMLSPSLTVGTTNLSSTFAGTIQDGNNPLSVTATGSGALTLLGTNTYSGGTTVNPGSELVFGSHAAMGTGGANVAVGNGAVVGIGDAIDQAFLNRLSTSSNGNTFAAALALSSSNNLNFSGFPQASLGAIGAQTYSGTLTPAGTTYLLGGGGGALAFASVLSGGGNSLVVGGPLNGMVALTGSNTYGGGTTVNSSVLQINNPASLGLNTGSLTLSGSSTLEATASFSDLHPITVNDMSTLVVDAGVQFTAAAAITGTGSLTKSGPGLLSLINGNNAYSGGTIVSQGTLALGAAGVLPSGNLEVDGGTALGGTLDLQSTSITVNGLSGLAGAVSGQIVNSGGGVLSTLTIGAGNASSASATQLNGANLALVKIGTGTIALSGTNSTFSGGTTVQQGLLSVAGASVLGVGPVALSGGTLTTTGAGTNTFVGPLSVTANSGIALGAGVAVVFPSLSIGDQTLYVSGSTSSSSVQINGPTALTGVSGTTFNVSGASPLVLTGAVSSPAGAALTKAGSGLLTLASTNSYTVPTTIAGGALQAVVGTSLPSASNLVLGGGVFQTSGSFSLGLGTAASSVQWTGDGGFSANGGSLQVSLDNGAPNPLVWGGTPYFVPSGNALIFNSPTANAQVQFVNNIDLNGAVRTVRVDRGTGGDSATIVGNLVDSAGSGGGLNKAGNGMLVLAGNNSFTGPVSISNAGTLELGSSAALNPSGVNTVSFNAGSTGVLTLNGNSLTVAGLSTDPSIPAGGVVLQNGNSASTAVTLTVNDAVNTTFAGVLQNGTSAAALGLTVGGPGMLTLTATNTFTGPINVTGGTLQGASTAIPSNVTLTNGANLTLNQPFNGTLTNSVSGNGSFTKSGAGMLIVTSGSNLGYSGATSITGGTLKIEPPLPSLPVTSGLVTYLDASTLTTTGALATWKDLSGLGYNLTQGTAALQPSVVLDSLDGKSMVHFTAASATSGDWMASTYNNTSGTYTIIGVGRMDATGQGRLVGSQNQNDLFGWWGGYENDFYTGNWIYQPNTATDLNLHMFALTASGTGGFNAYDLARSGTSSLLYSGTNTSANPIGNLEVGGYNSSNELSNADLGTVLVYNRALSSSEMGQIQAYLNAEWGGAATTNYLPATSTVNLSGGGTLDMTGCNESVAALSGLAGTQVLLGGGGTLTLGAAVNPSASFAGVISGSGMLIKSGTGVQALTGNNTYSAGTVLNAGTIQVSGSSSLGSGPLTFNSGKVQAVGPTTLANAVTVNSPTATFDTNGSNMTVSNIISGSGGLVKTGSGVMVVGYQNSYGGATQINGGTLRLTPSPFGNYSSLGVFQNVPETAGYTLAYELAIPNTANFNNAGVPYTVNQAALIPNGSFSRIGYYMELQTSSGSLQYVYASFNASAFSTSASMLGVPTQASGEFYHYGLATGQVQNMNIYSNVAGIVTGTGIQTGNVQFWPSNYTQNNDWGVPNASSTGTNSGFDFGDGGANNTSSGYGAMQIANYGASQCLISFNNWNNSSVPCVGLGNQTGGSGNALNWTFNTNAASYTVKNLEIVVGNPGQATAGPIPTTSVVTIGSTGILDVNGAAPVVAGLNGAAGSQITLGGGVLTINGTGGSNFAGNISGSGSLVKYGSDTLVLSGSNSYTSDTTINAGVLQGGAANVLPSGPGTGNLNLVSGTTFDLNGFSQAINGLNGAGTVDNRAAGASVVLTVGNNNASSTFSGTLVNTAGTLALAKTGSGTVTLVGNNSHSGGTTINQGILAISPVSATNPLGSSPITLNGGTLRFTGLNNGQQPLGVTGFTGDDIAEASASSPGVGTNVAGYFAWWWYEKGAPNSTQGLPNWAATGGTLSSLYTQSNGSHTLFQLQPYGATSGTTTTHPSNVAQVLVNTSLTMALNNAAPLSALQVLFAGNGTGNYNFTLNFSDSSSYTYSSNPYVDWTNNATAADPFAYANAGLTNSSGSWGGFYTNQLSLFENDFSVPAVDQSKALTSITFNPTSGGGLMILGLAGSVTNGLNNAYSNTVNVTSNSSIDLETSLYNNTVQLGNLNVNAGNTLSLTSTVSSGTLLVTGLNGPATSQIALGGNTLTVNGSGSSNFAGIISGSGGLVQAGAGTLTLGGNNNYTGTTAVSAGALTLSGSLAGSNVAVNGASAVFNEAASGVIGGAGATFTITAGTATLSGNNTYTGSTSVAGGRFLLSSGGSLGATAVTVSSGATFGINQSANASVNAMAGNLTLNAGSTFTMADGFTTTLNVGGNAALGASTFAFDLGGSTTAVDQLAITGTAAISAAAEKVIISPFGSTPLTLGSYTLITAGTGSTLTTNPLALLNTKVYLGGTPYALSLTNSAAMVTLNVAAIAGPDQAYWTGAAGNTWNAGVANFNTTVSGGTAVAALPAAGTDVFFTANVAGNLLTTPGTATTINSLNFLAASGAVTIGGASTLTINAGSVGNPGVTNASPSPQTVSAPVALGGYQTWTNNGSGLLTVGGNVSTGGFTLTTAGTGNTAIAGVVSGAGGLTAAGPGMTTLSGVNTYTGATTVAAGATLALPGTIGSGGGTAVTTAGTLTEGAAGVIAGTSALNVSGGVTTLNGVNTYSGSTAVSAGATLALNGTIANGGGITTAGTFTESAGGIISGAGALTVSGGSTTLAGLNTYTGITYANAGTLVFSGNAATATPKLYVGYYGSAAAVIQNSGNFSIGAGTFGQDVVSLGGGNGGYGFYLLNAGSLTTGQVALGSSVAGANLTGVMDVKNGSALTVASGTGWLLTGWNGTNPNGVLNIYNGTVTNLSTANDTTMALTANLGSQGAFNLLGPGALLVATGGGTTHGVNLAAAAGNTASFLNLNGGVLLTNYVKATTATPSYLGFNGGTLRANSANVGFIAGLTGATLYASGGTIDTNGYSVTSTNGLLAAAGNGLTSIALTSSGTGYIGEPAVRISGGGGQGASAIAEVDLTPGDPNYGQLIDIRITSPGYGYTSAPTVTLIGGGAASAGTAGTVGIGANTSGGLTVVGAGALTLNATSTYTGATTVAWPSSLLLGANGRLAATPVTVSGGATFGVKQTASSTSNTMAGSLTLNPNATFSMADGFTSTLSVSGNAAIGGGATLAFDLGGTGSVAASDLLAVAGSAAVAGPARQLRSARSPVQQPSSRRRLRSRSLPPGRARRLPPTP